MIPIICKKLQHIKARVSTTHHGYLFSTSSLNPILNSSNSVDPQSLTLSYLLNSCGLSLESAISASKKLQFETTDQPDSVLKLLKTHGLSQTHISNLITNRPGILLADPSKTLKPNIEFFGSLGFSGTNLANILSKTPQILESSNVTSVVEFFAAHGFSKEQITTITLKRPFLLTYNPQKIYKPKLEFLQSLGSATEVVRLVCSEPSILDSSLENRLIPCVRVLKGIVHTDENVLKAIRAEPRILQFDLEKSFEPNILTLLDLGVPESNVLKLIMLGPRILLQRTEQFNKIVREVTKLGFDPKKVLFVLAMRSMPFMRNTCWEEKLEVFSSFGLSRDEILLAFKLQPMCALCSKKKIREMMDFFVNKLHFKPSMISRHPNLLLLSLEKRIIPRCSVLQLLMLNNMIEGKSLLRIFKMTHKDFVQKFVIKYQHMVPEVVKAHSGELDFKGFT
uniref:Mitochondrial transcription termination factor family protein n=1 Tax=Davidia involucrata TaxID=16924 RepID=A0A5B6ZC02_DAVIN